MQQPKTCVIGATGRLGAVVAERFRARGDLLLEDGAVNYLVFAHRYRNYHGERIREEEMEVNALRVVSEIECRNWAPGDCAIVMVSSIDATDPVTHQPIAYSMSKAALNAAARYLAKVQPVRINTVSPATFTGEHPVVSKEQVAEVIAFLCSPQGSGINGQDIRVG